MRRATDTNPLSKPRSVDQPVKLPDHHPPCSNAARPVGSCGRYRYRPKTKKAPSTLVDRVGQPERRTDCETSSTHFAIHQKTWGYITVKHFCLSWPASTTEYCLITLAPVNRLPNKYLAAATISACAAGCYSSGLAQIRDFPSKFARRLDSYSSEARSEQRILRVEFSLSAIAGSQVEVGSFKLRSARTPTHLQSHVGFAANS